MLYIEKDDPREAPESGDKKPDPDKKQKSLKATLCGLLYFIVNKL